MAIFLRKALKVNSVVIILFRIDFIYSKKYFRFIKVLPMAFITSYLFLKWCSLPQIAAGKFLCRNLWNWHPMQRAGAEKCFGNCGKIWKTLCKERCCKEYCKLFSCIHNMIAKYMYNEKMQLVMRKYMRNAHLCILCILWIGGGKLFSSKWDRSMKLWFILYIYFFLFCLVWNLLELLIVSYICNIYINSWISFVQTFFKS